MTEPVTIQFRVVNGKLKGGVSALNKAIAQHEGKEVEVTIRRKRSKRTVDQNSYYWACMEVVSFAMFELGNLWDKVKCHDFFKAQFLRKVEFVNGVEVMSIGSTAGLGKSEFSDYMARVDEWCMDHLGFNLPKPEDQIKFGFE